MKSRKILALPVACFWSVVGGACLYVGLKPRVNLCVFFLVCAFILICGYNRMHMTNHFLSDVCFGTLNTFLITTGLCTVFTKSLQKEIR